MPINSSEKLSIADLFKGDLHLSSPPTVYFKLQRLIEDPSKSLADAALIIEKDASLSLKLLKVVNSAFYGFPSKVTSIQQAINLIGTKELQNITLSTIVIEKFSDLPGGLMSMHDFWQRSLRCALIAQGIDCFLGKRFAQSVFICGILHNIGQLVFFRRLPELSREINLMLEAQEYTLNRDEIKFERNIIGFDHYQTGAALTQLWQLPEIITQSIGLHASINTIDDYQEIASIIRVADYYSKLDDINIEDSDSHLGISAVNMSAIIAQSLEELDEILKVFI
ncbi:MAG: HDOD domain-containing protein [Methyloprofundus sp.]|nr:HDOD domain-containing protein [Methyloprofundus sp.]